MSCDVKSTADKSTRVAFLVLALGCTEGAPRTGTCVELRQQSLIRASSEPSLALTPQERASFGALTTAESEVICSGVLIADGWVLTARHCSPLGAAQPLSFRTQLGDSHVSAAAAQRFEHPDRDFALLRLASSMIGSPNVVALDLWRSTDEPIQLGAVLTLVGFGKTETGQSGTLGFLDEPVVEIDEVSIVVDGGNDHGACSGDSGGPLLALANDGAVRIAGILSTGENRCAGRDRYLRVDGLTPWIKQVVAKHTAAPCAGLDWEGVCADGRATWCADGRAEAQDCINHQLCGWDVSARGYRCVHEESDPCIGASPSGLCDGNLLRRCDHGRLREVDCSACGLRCQWNNEGAECLET